MTIPPYSSSSSTITMSSASAPTTDEEYVHGGGLIHISTPSLVLSMAPLLFVIIATTHMQLDLATSIISSTLRTIIQLSILGAILHPIFASNNIFLVLGYCFVMVVIAAHVSCSRTKYTFQGQFLGVFGCLIFNVVAVASFSFLLIIRPRPVWDPQYLIPIVGMILGNCVNGISLTMDQLSTSLVEQQREIELYLSFGATYREAVSRPLREAVKSGTTPLLNSMAVIGIVAIPGMMTGQILGGSSVADAARYQILIMYLIATTTFGVVLMEIWIVLRVGFDGSSHMLRPERFSKQVSQKSALTRIGDTLTVCFRGATNHTTDKGLVQSNRAEMEPLHPKDLVMSVYDDEILPSHGTLQIHNLKESKASFTETNSLLSIEGLTRSVKVCHGDDLTTSRILFKDMSLQLRSGEIVAVTGPSGSGKSQLLRAIAALSPVHGGKIELDGRDWKYRQQNYWRKQVRYVTQYKVDIPGTPSDFIRRVTGFKSWVNDSSSPTSDEMTKITLDFLKQWGMKSDRINAEWTALSGGEAQRIMVALALSSSPKVLLLDESTSALDIKSKLAVERSIERFIDQFGCKALLVSHDDEQMERLNRNL